MSEGKQIDDGKRASDETIKLLVGPDKQVFYLHERLLDKAPYLKLQLRQDSAAIELQNVNVTSFRYALGWLYTGNLPNLILDEGLFDEDAFDALYKVADTLMITELKSKLRAYVCPVPRVVKNTRNAGD